MISFLVEDWMMGKGLGLKGCDLPVFAYAYSFHKKGKSLFISEGNLGELVNYSRKQVGITLKRLCKRGLLIRSETKHPEFQTYSYSVCEEKVRSFVTPGCEETSQGGCEESSHPDGKKRYIPL